MICQSRTQSSLQPLLQQCDYLQWGYKSRAHIQCHHQCLLSLLPVFLLVSSTSGVRDVPCHVLCDAVTPGVGQRLPLTPALCWRTPDTAERASLVQMIDGSEGGDGGTSHALASVNKGNKTCIREPLLWVGLSKCCRWLNMQQSCGSSLNSCERREEWLDFRVWV